MQLSAPILFLMVLIPSVQGILKLEKYYKPEWSSLDARPLPGWFDDVKFGIFCHWGVYSVPAFHSEWFWSYWQGKNPDPEVVDYVNKNYKPKTTYADFAQDFTAELFDANQFKDIVEASGAKYFVITSKHHEGFTLWKSPTSWNWNAVDVGPKRDILAELKRAFTNSSAHFGLYFSHMDWFHPYYLENITKFVEVSDVHVEEVSYPQLVELVEKYEPDLIWTDGDWEKTDVQWKSKEFLAWLYNKSPVKEKVVVNDRWGAGTPGKHGGYLTYADHFDPGYLLERKWENCLTLDIHSWGNRRGMTSGEVQDVHSLIQQLARTVSCGGNMLLNIGPDNHGSPFNYIKRKTHGHIPAIFEDRLRELGDFLRPNSLALYQTKAAPSQNDTGDTWYTKRKTADGVTIYAWILNTTADSLVLSKISPNAKTKVTILATNGAISWDSVSTTEGQTAIRINLRSVDWRKLPRSDVIVLAIQNPVLAFKRRLTKSWQEDFIVYLRTLKQKPRPSSFQ